MNGQTTLTLSHLVTGFRLPEKKEKILSPALSFTARPGELTAVIGPNGIGKTTLLRTILGFLSPLGGTLSWDHKDITSLSLHERSLLFSFVPAGKMPVARLTVEDVVAFSRYPHTGWLGKKSDQDHLAVEESIRSLNLNHLRHRNIDQLSDGERQRTWIARALAQETDILIMDEPTSFLDIPTRYDIYNYLKNIAADRNKLILFASHDLEFVLGMCSKVWLLLPGAAIEGAPEDLLARGAISRLLGDSGVTYDPVSGLQFTPPEPITQVYLTGRQEQCNWIKMALHRSGIGITDHPELADSGHIICGEKEILFTKKERKIRFSTIYALILFLKQTNA